MTLRFRHYTAARCGRVSVPVLLLILAIAGAGSLMIPSVRQSVSSLFGSSGGGTGQFIVHPVTANSFRITITENGQIDSLRNATLSNRVEGSTTIISIVTEGTRVNPPTYTNIDGIVELPVVSSESVQTVRIVAEDGQTEEIEVALGGIRQLLVRNGQRVKVGDYIAGDVVCELDSSTLVDSELQQQIKVTESLATLKKAESDLKIQESTNKKFEAAARLAETLAQLDFESYTFDGGEYDQAVETIQGDVKQTEEELAIAQEEYDRVREQARRGYTSLFNLEAARVKVTQKQIVLNVKKGELTVLEQYTRKRTESELEQMRDDTREDTLRAILEGEAAMAQFQASYDAAKINLAVEEQTLERLRRQIADCRLVAPQAGEVVYAKESSRSREPALIEVGAAVRERQPVIKLPDLDHMKIDARIHESRIREVAVGQLVEIEVDALRNLNYHGVLETLSSVPIPGEWPNTSVMEFEAEVKITDSVEMKRLLKPGMKAELRIIVEDRTGDVIQIPVQSVLPVAGEYFTYVLEKDGPQRRQLSVGMSNDEFVEILDGVTIGERVIMNPRTHFSQEINDLQQQLTTQERQDNAPDDAEVVPDSATTAPPVKAAG